MNKKIISLFGIICVSIVFLVYSITVRAEGNSVEVGSKTIEKNQTTAESNRKADDKTKTTWQTSAAKASAAALKSVLNTLAYDTATWIGSGGKGQKPTFITEGWSTYLSNVADNAAGTFIEEIGKQGLSGTKFNLCEPNFNVTMKIGLGLVQYSKPTTPSCTFTTMTKNWKTAADKWRDMSSSDYLAKLQSSFEPASNDVGVALSLQTGITEDVESKKNIKTTERSSSGGWLNQTSIGGIQKTPPGEAAQLEQQQRTDFGAQLSRYTGDAVVDAANVFLNQLAITAFNTLLQNITGSESTESYSNWDSLFNEQSSVSSPSGGTTAVSTEVANKLMKPNFSTKTDYNILVDLSSCPNPSKAGPTNCVITDKFMQAIIEKKTVGEAMKLGYLNKNGAFGFLKDGYEPNHVDEAYPYRSMLILRKFRIIPVGWELAAQYIKASSTLDGMNLEKLVQCFDPNDDYTGYYADWCRGLVDPNWVLKAPKNYCKRLGYGPELTSTQVVGEGSNSTVALTRNGNYCADEQSCIQENDDGSCQAYGYCVKEKRKWNFNAKSCDANYNTCQAFKTSDGKVVNYLENTLNYSGCSSDNAGCKAYATQYDYSTSKWADSGSKIYMDRDAAACDPKNEGCHEFIRTKPGLGTNLLTDPSFEDDITGTIWQGAGAQIDDAYEGRKSLQLAGNLSLDVAVGPSDFNVAGERFALSLYAKNCSSDATFGLRDTSSANALSPLASSDGWSNNKFVYVYPAAVSTNKVTIEINNSSANCQIDAVKLERGAQATGYSDYRTNGLVYEKLLPDYLSNGSAHNNVCYDSKGALKSGAPAACSAFVRTCTADEAGCEMYTSAKDGVGIPGKVTAQDYCPAECVGYDTYVQQKTVFDTSRYNYLIPSTAAACTAEAVGCEEFTNLDAVSKGGEGIEYYSYLKQCVKTDATTGLSQCGEFYTWEGSDETGYQLKVLELKKNGSEPTTTSPDDKECTAAIYNLPSTDPSYNPDCRQFYDKSGIISYHLMERTITCSDNCFAYRETRKNVDPGITSAANCSGDDKFWDSGTSQCYKCENGGTWDIEQQACVYSAIPGEGNVCKASDNGCREYSGNSGNNMSIVLNNDFEGSLQDWVADTAHGASASSSNMALMVGGRSLSVSGGNNLAGVILGTKVMKGKSYVLSFIALGQTAGVSLSAKIGNSSSATDFSGAAVLSGGEWRRFELNMVELDHEVSSDERLIVAGTGGFYIDNVKLMEITDRYYLIENSWNTPDTCNQDEKGDPYPLFALGCDAYTDSDKNTYYLHSFSHLCQDSAVGCELMIDTENSTDYHQKTTNGNPAVTTPADKFVYAVFDKTKQCSAIDKGCQRLGKPYNYENMSTLYSDVYLKNDPDKYSSILCGSDAVNCAEWATSDGSNVYFRDPGDQACEWRQKAASSNADRGGLGWFKKKIKHCGGTHDGALCSKDSDCAQGAASSTCAVYDLDEPCPVSAIKTFGKGGYKVEQPAVNQNGYWAGVCPAAEANCTEYIDPSSKFSTDLVANSQVRLSPNTLYVFEGGASVSNCKNKDSNTGIGSIFYKLGSDNNIITPGVSSVTAGSNMLVYLADNTQDVSCGANGVIRRAGVEYQDSTKIDTKTCNGMVDFEKGCVLFNERAQNGTSMAPFTFNSFSTWDAERTAVGGTTYPVSDQDNNANKILKVSPDRDCDGWIACRSLDSESKVCKDLAICNKLDENGYCERFQTTSPASARAYPTNINSNYIADISGFAKAAYYNINKDDKIHPHPDDYYQFESMTSYGAGTNISNGSFEEYQVNPETPTGSGGTVDYTRLIYYPKYGWDNTQASDKKYTEVLTNPVAIQKDGACFRKDSTGNCTIYAPEGRSMLKMTNAYNINPVVVTQMGSEPSVIGAKVFAISGYVDAQKLSAGKVQITVSTWKLNYANMVNGVNQSSYTATNEGVVIDKDGNGKELISKNADNGDGWVKIFSLLNLPANSQTTNIKIEIRAVDYNSAYPVGSFYVDDLHVRSILDSGKAPGTSSEWYTEQSCRLYPKEDSLGCDYYDTSGIRYKGRYGYCLDYDRYPGSEDACLLWWPVPNNVADDLNEICGDGQATGNEDCDCPTKPANNYCSKIDPGTPGSYYSPAGTTGHNQYSCTSCTWTGGWCGDNVVDASQEAFGESCDWNENNPANPNLTAASGSCTADHSSAAPIVKSDFAHDGYYDYLWGTLHCYDNSNTTYRCRLKTPNNGGTDCSDALANSSHTRKQCISAGGKVVNKDGVEVTDGSGNITDRSKVGDGNKEFFCKLSGSSCPSGWTKYGNWSTTNSNHCTAAACSYGGGCITGSHAWGNTAAETCAYTSGSWSCDPIRGCTCKNTSNWCLAVVTQVGCY